MAIKITDDLVKGLEKPEAGNSILYDDKVKGFGIRISAGGAKSFILNYRNLEGTEKRLTIGRYGPNEWSVEKARKRAGELKRAINNGDDPLGEKQTMRAAPTVDDLCDRYVREHLPRKRDSSRASDEGLIKTVRDRLGNRKVASIEFADIEKLHQSMKATPYRANRTLALLSKMFSLALKWRLRTDHPCKGVERFSEVKRKRYLKAPELATLTETLRLAEAELTNGPQAANVVRLLLLTGCRKGEALAARWEQMDLDAGVWTKPGATTKQKTEHEAPLSDAAVLLLKEIRKTAGDSPYIFPFGDGHLPDIREEWDWIRVKAKIADVRIHDLRHTFASILASAGASLPMIGALLGHSTPSTTARYAHLFNDPLRQLANTAGNVLSGNKGADVVSINRGAA